MCFSCVCVSKFILTLDGFINDLYKQNTFWFNGCLNASFIIVLKKLMACNYCLNYQTKHCNIDYQHNHLALQCML
jgi:uncharacterized protein YggL (DUF469 family)